MLTSASVFHFQSPVTLKWKRNGEELGSRTHDDGEGVLTLRDIEAGDSGDYVCVAMAERYINIARVTLSVRGKSSPLHQHFEPNGWWLISCR